MYEDLLWVEKYRPKKISDCVLPARTKKIFSDYVAKKDFPNLLLAGSAGTGKTTVARALCNELDKEYIIVNASDDRNIDMLRNTLRSFCSTISLDGREKVAILDEADYLNQQSVMPALRGFIEEYGENVRFILTCNYKNRIIDPLQSRLSSVDFLYSKDEEEGFKLAVFKRLRDILDAENIKYDLPAVGFLLKKYFPDVRKVINELQKLSKNEQGIVFDAIQQQGDDNFNELVKLMAKKEFLNARQWVANNLNNDPQQFFRKFYEQAKDVMADTTSHAELVVLIAEYQYKSSMVADQEINFTAFLATAMAQLNFKNE